MKCHQVLTGACNVGDKSFSVGSVEGVTLIAYAAGCNIIILANNFHRVQIIPGICHNNVQITCVDVSNDTGKIAVAYENKVCVFEPTPLLHRDSSHGLDYWWVQTGQLDLECVVANIAWNHEGTRLLTAGDILQLWRYADAVRFNIGDGNGEESGSWECVWRVRPASPVVYLAFSADGTLFATAGKHDRLVRIWYQNQQLLLPSQGVENISSNVVTYSFIYVTHPRPVTGFSWRATSRYMPRGAVANILVTNCMDNICRIWSETLLPDDGLICMQQLDPAAAQDPHFRAHRQKQRFIQRLKHMRQSFTARKLSKAAASDLTGVQDPIPTLPSTYSIHDFHNFSFQGTGISPGLHFHLSATINATTDIPLVPTMTADEDGGVSHKFGLHWLNNKEMFFSLEAGKILRELARLALTREDSSGVELEMVQQQQGPVEADNLSTGKPGPERSTRAADGGSVAETQSGSGGMSHAPSITSFNTDISQPSSMSGQQMSLSEALDQKIESLLREWHQSSDLLFSVHPVDGSLLVWVADFLDEYQPGEFRQAQVSFSSRIPNAIPIGDASTMSSNISVFNPLNVLNLNDLIRYNTGEDDIDKEREDEERPEVDEDNENDDSKDSKPTEQQFAKFSCPSSKYEASPLVSMISKHENGSLNLWDATFLPDTNFSQLLNISHRARVNGHRFRVNDITSHPVLPLLLTTSHHNMLTEPSGPASEQNFSSELILWRVSPISPVSKPGSGGISELARINSRHVSAFTHVAWLPTLLPSTVLGAMTNSPSACFVSSDGQSLRVYQAVIDARSLLSELNSSKVPAGGNRSSAGSVLSDQQVSPSRLNPAMARLQSSIVSAQSSARPGVVLELDQIADAEQSWHNTLMLHTFQAEMVSGPMDNGNSSKLGLIPSSMSAMVDLRGSSSGFSELFYVVVAEKTGEGALMHMWQLELASSGDHDPAVTPQPDTSNASHVSVTSSKVSTQSLPLPPHTHLVHCVPAAGHLSSSSIYPACLAPYILVTACSDNTVRFWCNSGAEGGHSWHEWQMEAGSRDSSITVPGTPVSVSAAYSGRIAVAYRAGHSFHRKSTDGDPTTNYVNLYVAIYECESTGGSEWVLEDRILLKNVELPKLDLGLDQTVFEPQDRKVAAMAKIQRNLGGSKADSEGYYGGRAGGGLSKVPSVATVNRLKEGLAPSACDGLVQKRLVQLDWVSNEDGSHILTVSVSNKVMLLTTVSSEIAQANMTAASETRKDFTTGQKRPLLRKSSSLSLQPVVDEWRWMTFRRIELRTVDGLAPLPMAVAWARDGVLLCAMENEVAVYSQWRPEEDNQEKAVDSKVTEEVDNRRLKDEDLFSLAQESQLRNITSGGKLASGANMKYLSEAEDKARETQMVRDEDLMPDVGLFEASHLACPVLPQYHPKQLMELLNSGKIRWVKAILSHLVKNISPTTGHIDSSSPRDWAKSRTLSLSASNMDRSPSPKRSSTSAMPEEITLDYSEIRSVPPLPLWLLLAADKEKGSNAEASDEYNQLFNTDSNEPESLTLDFSIEDDEMPRERRHSIAPEKQGLSYFGPRQSRLLSKLLTHTQLPGLTSLDQMHLLALADTVASCNLDLAEKFAIDAAKTAMKETLNTSGETSLESLDDCGLRCLLAMKNHCYLKRCLPMGQRAALAKAGLNTSNIIWGFQSESEEELVSFVPSVQKGNPTWTELKELGVVWWVRSNTVLRKLVERLAKAAFQKDNDPLDAALFYLAMKKKSLVWGLFRSQRDETMTKFFSNDFKDERWRKAALKNAFALLGKQRFHHAAAFFLLSGSLKDALEIILGKLEDIQLAILVGRLYEGGNDNNPPSVVAILKKYILGGNEGNDDYDLSLAHPDPFYRSMAYWIVRDYESSLSTLILTQIGENHPAYKDDDATIFRKKTDVDPCVFNFYVYLRSHPLIMRQRVAKRAEDKGKALMLSGFKSNNTEKATTNTEDSVTPLERRLFFTTAHFHLRSGCPALALEVLNKLPAKVADQESEKSSKESKEATKEAHVETGNLNEDHFDWSQLGKVDKPKVEKKEPDDFGFDWGGGSVAVSNQDDELKLEWSEDEDENDEDDDDFSNVEKQESKISKRSTVDIEEEPEQVTVPEKIDIMAQQLKFMACLKIMMEELSTLATGFEADGGTIRHQLYVWLEKEVEALNELCSYGAASRGPVVPMTEIVFDDVDDVSKGASLHNVILSEKQDFETRMTRQARRKKWLAANQTLIRTLLSYCGLHGANGGGLTNVGMELVFLLQELQQEQTPHQLLSPLPFPTTLPLLSACIAQQKTVVIDPVHHLQTMVHDMLFTLSGHKQLPVPGSAKYSTIFLLRDLAVALSGSVHQSLCDSDGGNYRHRSCTDLGLPESVNRLSMLMSDSYLMFSPAQRKQSTHESEIMKVVTDPIRWPGVTQLKAMLDREKDHDTPNLNIFLCETYAAVYISLLMYGLATCDCHILYRLVTQKPTKHVWSQMFGGGARKQLSVETSGPVLKENLRTASDEGETLLSSGISSVTNITKQRIKMNMKLLNVQLGSSPQEFTEKTKKQTYKEQFLSPEMSIMTKLMTKTPLESNVANVDYDSGEESDHDVPLDELDDEDDDPFSNVPPKAANTQHTDPDSYAWDIIRLATLNLAQKNIECFLLTAGIELQELPLASPFIYKCLRTTERWSHLIIERLMKDGKPPDNFIPGCFPDSTATGPKINKYKAMLEPHNNPFPSVGVGLGPIKRLWRFLVNQEPVQCIFIRYIFGKSKPVTGPSVATRVTDKDDGDTASRVGDESLHNFGADEKDGKLRIIHKEQDNITAFCINKVTNGLMTVSTPREIMEINMNILLHPSSWSDRADDEAENDILMMQEEAASGPKQAVTGGQQQAPGDPFHFISNLGGASGHNSMATSPSGSQPSVGAGKTHGPDTTGKVSSSVSHVVKRHKCDGVRRLVAHPHLPLYITGGQDGAISIWEWSHTSQVATVRQAGIFAKVNKIVFTQQGNKFGVCDGDGNTALWQAANTSSPYFNLQTHNRNTADMIFQGGSSSLLATAGHSSDGRNVAIWDTLLPTRKACVQSFSCHEAGAAALLHASQHHLIISAGKKGQVCIWDVRQGKLLHSFKAHDHAVKCVCMNTGETMFCTGSADGDIKVWDLNSHRVVHTYQGEHARHGLFKNISQGVAQLSLIDGTLFSCGADGSMKMRKLPERDVYVNC